MCQTTDNLKQHYWKKHALIKYKQSVKQTDFLRVLVICVKMFVMRFQLVPTVLSLQTDGGQGLIAMYSMS